MARSFALALGLGPLLSGCGPRLAGPMGFSVSSGSDMQRCTDEAGSEWLYLRIASRSVNDRCFCEVEGVPEDLDLSAFDCDIGDDRPPESCRPDISTLIWAHFTLQAWLPVPASGGIVGARSELGQWRDCSVCADDEEGFVNHIGDEAELLGSIEVTDVDGDEATVSIDLDGARGEVPVTVCQP